MQIKSILLAVLLVLLLLGCTTTRRSSAPIDAPVNESIENESLEEGFPEAPDSPLPPEEHGLPVTYSTYTDERGNILFDYPATWRIKNEIRGGGGLSLDMVDPAGMSDNKIQVRYSASQRTLEQQMQELQRLGTPFTNTTIGNVTFLVYQTEFDPLPGKRMIQRVATTNQHGLEYRISLISRPYDFEALLPIYESVLASVRIV